MEQIRKTRGVPAKRGGRVFYSYEKRYGTITGSRGGYLPPDPVPVARGLTYPR